MTNYVILYNQALAELTRIPVGTQFRLTDICDNPPTGLGRIFRNDVVVKKRFPGIVQIYVGYPCDIYEKQWQEDFYGENADG